MSYNLSPTLRQRFLDSNGDPLAGGFLYSYQAGTTTPQATYTSSSGAANANPVVLDADGEADVWLDPALSYKFVLKNSSGVTQWTVDNVIGTLAADAVSTSALQDLSVTTAKINTGAVTVIKLDSTSFDAGDALNMGLAASVGASALTITLKDAAGSTPSATSPVKIVFRSATSATGTPVVRSATAATSITVTASASLGLTASVNQYVWVYALDNAGTVELAVAGNRIFDEGATQSTTAMSGSATSNSVLYSTSARSGVAVRLIGRLKVSESSFWASAPTEVSLMGALPMQVRSCVHVDTGVSGAGHGAVNTKIRRFTNIRKNVGTAITYADSSNNGASFTINEDGLFSITYIDHKAGATAQHGISLNSNQLTTAIASITAADVLMYVEAGSSLPSGCAITVPLVAGDVIRPHTSGDQATSTIGNRFIITKVGN